MADVPAWLAAARAHWHWRGHQRPAFAAVPLPGQVSVWDFPRPPRLAPDPREVVVRWGSREVARTRGAICVLETSHPPSWYLPWADVDRRLFAAAAGASFCEWKGPARYWDLVDPEPASQHPADGAQRLPGAAWSYPQPLGDASTLAECVALYPSVVDCFVDGTRVQAQPGGFYGGWITPELVGPFKGGPGSSGW